MQNLISNNFYLKLFLISRVFLASAFSILCAIGTYITHAMLTAMTSVYVAPYKSGSTVLSMHLGLVTLTGTPYLALRICNQRPPKRKSDHTPPPLTPF